MSTIPWYFKSRKIKNTEITEELIEKAKAQTDITYKDSVYKKEVAVKGVIIKKCRED